MSDVSHSDNDSGNRGAVEDAYDRVIDELLGDWSALESALEDEDYKLREVADCVTALRDRCGSVLEAIDLVFAAIPDYDEDDDDEDDET